MPTKTKKDRTKDENGNSMDPFEEILQVLDVEKLIRIRYLLKKVGKKRMVEILTEKIQEKEEEPPW